MVKHILVLLITVASLTVNAQQKEFKCNEEWLETIRTIAPQNAEVQAEKSRKILVFDKCTGYKHWVIPHTTEVIKILGTKTGAYEVEVSSNILKFENLKKYDAVVLNNNCSIGPRRNLFFDVLDEDKSLNEKQKAKKAAELEANLIKYVKKGGGLMVVHGAITMQNNSMPFSEMVGGSFDYHPKQQEITVELCEPDHPLVKAFDGKNFVHIDEPYLFNKAYSQKNFRPLLYMDTTNLSNKKKPIDEKIKYVAWIKKHGKGRVFFVSPAHNAQSFEDVRLLKFYLDGTQYVLGDLKCDDSPLNK